MALTTETFNFYQASPAAVTATDLLAAIAAQTKVFVRCIKICNTGASAVTVRVWVVKSPDGDALTKQYLYYDTVIPANGTLSDADGFPLPTAAKIRCYASATGVSFQVFVDEIT